MKFDLDEAVRVLFRTPAVFYAWLGDMPDARVRQNEGPETWSAFDVVGHLIQGEKHDWIPRLRMILSKEKRPFEPFDRFAMIEADRGRSMQDLLDEFRNLRLENVKTLREMSLTEGDLDREGTHPDLGSVTIRELIATWIAHDQAHITQTGRVLTKSFGTQVGPWREYFSLLD